VQGSIAAPLYVSTRAHYAMRLRQFWRCSRLALDTLTDASLGPESDAT
jgi:hypothetical protein